MLKIIITFGVLFVFGNVLWDKFGLNEPKIFYVPLAIFISSMVYYIRLISEKESIYIKYFLNYLFALSLGNIVKQIFYSPMMKQVNDYWWGGICSLILIGFILWEIRTQRHGRK